jgi:hypothetical protein
VGGGVQGSLAGAARRVGCRLSAWALLLGALHTPNGEPGRPARAAAAPARAVPSVPHSGGPHAVPRPPARAPHRVVCVAVERRAPPQHALEDAQATGHVARARARRNDRARADGPHVHACARERLPCRDGLARAADVGERAKDGRKRVLVPVGPRERVPVRRRASARGWGGVGGGRGGAGRREGEGRLAWGAPWGPLPPVSSPGQVSRDVAPPIAPPPPTRPPTQPAARSLPLPRGAGARLT